MIEIQYFHPEDELFSRSAEYVSFPFINQPELEETGMKISGLLLLIGKPEFESAIGELPAFLGVNRE